jgi:hypothetical protein
MYCPKCSQQQVSDEMRFCSRCGFPLSAVRELIAASGALVGPEAEAQGGQLSRSQRGVRKGAWMMLASLALTLVVGLLSAIDDDFAVLLLLPVLCFIIGFARVLYGVFLAGKRSPQAKGAAAQPNIAPIVPGQLDTAARTPELSPPRVAPIEGFTAQRMKTAEMVQPASVTENTTRLLDEEADTHRG